MTESESRIVWVSLIAPLAPGSDTLVDRLVGYDARLRAAGYRVEVLAVADPRDQAVAASGLGPGPEYRILRAETRGKAAAAYLGMQEAQGDVLLIVDLEKGYSPEDLLRLINPLVRGEADVAVASSHGGPRLGAELDPRRRLLGLIARPLTGIRDPSSGLIALTRTSHQARQHRPGPLGSRFVLELLVGSVGRRIEVPLARNTPPHRMNLFPSDLRLIKRLADDRFGNYSRLVQFCVVGASGMVVDLTTYAVLQVVFRATPLSRIKGFWLGAGQSLDLVLAAALAIAVALVWNFSLNRRLTFNDARQGSITRQFITYALSNALGIALSLTLRLFLPARIDFFARHRLAAAVVGIVAATGISFSMSRWVVFHRRTTTAPPSRPRSRELSAELEADIAEVPDRV